jgi:hypothetical protein
MANKEIKPPQNEFFEDLRSRLMFKDDVENERNAVAPTATAQKPGASASPQAAAGPEETSRVSGIVTVVLASGFLLSVLLPIITRTVGLKATWLVFAIWMASSASVAFSKSNRARLPIITIASMAVWLGVIVVNIVFDRGAPKSALIHLLMGVSHVMAVVMGAVVGMASDWVKRSILVVVIVLLGIQAAISLPTLYTENGIGRELMDDREEAHYLQQEYARKGVGDFNLYTALAVLLPTLLGTVLLSSWRIRIGTAIALVAIMASLLLSTFTAAFAIASFGLFTLVGGMNWRRGFVGMAFVYGSLIMAIAGGLVILQGFGELKQVNFVTDKLVRLFEGITAAGVVEGDETARGHLASMSLATFLEDPLVGIGPVTMVENAQLYRQVGGHCTWLDQLAEYGILGFAPFLFALCRVVKGSIRAWRNSRSIEAAGICVTAVSFAIAGLVNPAIFVESIAIPVLFILSMLSTAGK